MAKKKGKSPPPMQSPDPAEWNVYVTFVLYAVTGDMGPADELMRAHRGAVEKVARFLRRVRRPRLEAVYRGVILGPREVPADMRLSMEGIYAGNTFVSFSEDPAVACWFADPRSTMSQVVVAQRGRGAQGFVIEHQPKEDEVLFHHSWAERFPLPGTGGVPLWRLARMHPHLAHAADQCEWNMRTQREVLLKPAKSYPMKSLDQAGCPPVEELEQRFTHPSFRHMFGQEFDLRQLGLEPPQENPPAGDCYRFAFEDLKRHGGVLVHGRLWHPWDKKHFNHAWVERGGLAHDWQTQGSPRTIEQFHSTWRPEQARRYDVYEAQAAATRHGHYGPWDEVGYLPTRMNSMDTRRRDLERAVAAGDPHARRELAGLLLRADPAAAEPLVTGSNDFDLTWQWWQAMVQAGLADARDVSPSPESVVNYVSPNMIGNRKFLQWAQTEAFLRSIAMGSPRRELRPVTFVGVYDVRELRPECRFGEQVTFLTSRSFYVLHDVAEIAQDWFDRRPDGVVVVWTQPLVYCEMHSILYAPSVWSPHGGHPPRCSAECTPEPHGANFNAGVLLDHGRAYRGSSWPTVSVQLEQEDIGPGWLDPNRYPYVVSEVARAIRTGGV